MGIGAIWRALCALCGAMLRRGGEARDDFTAVTEAAEGLITNLRADLDSTRSRCDRLQEQVDKLIEEVHALRRDNFTTQQALGECKAQHARDGERIAELEREVGELKREG